MASHGESIPFSSISRALSATDPGNYILDLQGVGCWVSHSEAKGKFGLVRDIPKRISEVAIPIEADNVNFKPLLQAGFLKVGLASDSLPRPEKQPYLEAAHHDQEEIRYPRSLIQYVIPKTLALFDDGNFRRAEPTATAASFCCLSSPVFSPR